MARKKTCSVIEKISMAAAKTLALSALAIQGAYVANNIYYVYFPSPERAAFRREFGIPILGYRSDVENGGTLVEVVAALRREQMTSPLGASAVIIESENPLKRDVYSTMINNVLDTNGHYSPLTRTVSCSKSAGSTWIHEIKHAKSFAVARQHPEFIAQWKELAKDEKGTGFDLWEDIATVCEVAEIFPEAYRGEDPFREKTNTRIKERLELVHKYELIPRDFFDCVEALRFFAPEKPDKERAEEKYRFIQTSQHFVETHPDSVYTGYIRKLRGDEFFYEVHNSEGLTEGPQIAIREYRAGLGAAFKDVHIYYAMLRNLGEIYQALGDSRRVAIYDRALRLYNDRLKGNDLSLTERGVNDFLSSVGEIPKK